ncbi:MAG: Ig-like domain-containing protein [Cyclobacteriaceae bacterium]
MFKAPILFGSSACIKIFFLLSFSFFFSNSFSQCGCDFTIPAGAGTYYFNGTASGVQPGDVICIQAGSRGGLQFTSVIGAPDNPVKIVNCGGQALIGGPTSANAILFIGSRNIHVTGTGDPAFTFGLKIIQTAAGTQGLAAAGLSSDFEIDHMEIQNIGYTGIMIKSDPSSNCANTAAVRPNFTLYNVSIHHNYIHDTGGEGIYLGDSFYQGTTVFCGSVQYCHEVRGVRIFDNRFENTGREAIQVGSGVNDVEIYNNQVFNYGQAALSAQNGGIQMGTGTAGRCYNNFIKGGVGPAIACQGIGNDYIYNNIIVNPGEQAVTVNPRPTPLLTDIVPQGFLGGIYIINNTVINGLSSTGVFAEFINNAPGNVLYNNLLVNCTSAWDKLYSVNDWTKGNNIVIPNLADAKFVDPAIDDYRLQPTSPAINAGTDVTSFGILIDYDSLPRPAGATWDAGAFEFTGNQKPIVTLGPDQDITLPTNSTTITGSASDADGTVVSYLWTKQSGPNATLGNQTTTTVQINDLVAGVYVFRLTATDDGGETGFKDATVTVTDPSVNQPPVSNAGIDKTIQLPTNSTTLSGTGSDPDGAVITYAWVKVSGPAATMTNANSATLSLTALVEGVYVFRLTVTDDDSDVDTDDVQVTVLAAAVNQNPAANAGADKNLVLPTNSVNLTGSGSDADGSIAVYAWTKISGPAATMTNANTSTLQLTALVQGTYVFRLTVTDDDGGTGFNEASVTVSAANQPPVANAGANKTIQLPTNSTTLSGSGTDDDGTVVSYAWAKISGPAATMANANTATLTLTNLVQGVYVFRLTVTDDDAATGSKDVTVTVQAANVSPTANPGTTKTLILPDNSVSLVGSGSDVDGTIDTYAWIKVSGPAATTAGAATSTLNLTNLVEGSYVFRLTVTDNIGATGSGDVSVVVLPATINQAPVVNAGADITLTLPADNIDITGTASDPDGTISSYLWEKLSGPTVTLSGTTTLTLSLDNLLEGTYVFSLTATDNDGATTTDNISVIVSSINQSPIVNGGPDQIITLPQSTATITATASDADGTIATYLWTVVSGPSAPTLAGETTNALSVTGLIGGTYIFRITVTDNSANSSFDNVNVVLQSAGNVNPTANAGPDISLFLPTNATNVTGSGADADGTIQSYSWTQTEGSPATLGNANTNTLSISDLVAGVYVFRLVVGDDQGGNGIDDVTITVYSSSVNQAPTANAGPDIALTLPVNSTNLIGSGSDVDGSVSNYNWVKVSGPTATLSNSSTAVLSVQDLVDGIYLFELTVTDNNGQVDSDVVQITVLPSTVNQNPTVLTGNDITITLPTNIANLTVQAADPDGAIVSYAWVKVIGPAVTISGETTSTLSLSDIVEGTYVFRITVTDNVGASSFEEIIVTVLPLGSNQPPVVSTGIDKVLFLPANSLNISGSASDADGSISTYSWSKISGPTAILTNETLPTLSLGNLVAGQYVFRLTATDDQGATAFDEVAVTVFPGTLNQSPIANAGSNKTVILPNTTVTLSGSGFDPDGSIVSYTWTQTSGASCTIQNINSPTLIVNNLSEGVFEFQLTVADNLGSTGSNIANVTVVPEGTNQPPTANSGFDQIVNLPQNNIVLQGAGSDPDGSISGYNWTKTSGPVTVTISGENTSALSLTDLVAGTYRFVMEVTDNEGLSNSDEVKIIVVPGTVNNNPVVNAGPDIFLRLPVNSTNITATASDADGTVTSYLWTKQSGPAATLGPASSAVLSLTDLVQGTYVFKIEVVDDKGANASDEVSVVVAPPGINNPPVVFAGSGKVITLPTNTVLFNGSAFDTDGSITSIVWSQQNGPTTATLTGINTTTLTVSDLALGIYTFQLTVQDNENSETFSQTTVEVTENHPLPEVFAGNDTTLVLPDNFLALKGTASSADGFIVSFDWSQVDGPVTELVGEYPSVSLVDLLTGVYTFRLTVTDNFGAMAFDDMLITVKEGKSNPIGAALFFSPNGDPVNDFWFVRNMGMVQGCPVKIYNNLGKKVFEASSYQNDWNGTMNGQSLREGDYYYVFECGNEKTYAGAVRLIR